MADQLPFDADVAAVLTNGLLATKPSPTPADAVRIYAEVLKELGQASAKTRSKAKS